MSGPWPDTVQARIRARPSLTATVRRRDDQLRLDFDLTPRETEVLRCLVRGLSYKATAMNMGISIDTVRGHIRTIYGKLRVNKAALAVSRALQEGLV